MGWEMRGKDKGKIGDTGGEEIKGNMIGNDI